MNKWKSLVAYMVVFALLFGCSNVGSYVKETYPLVDVQGKGKDSAKVYMVEGQDVPTVAKELQAKEKPKETSEESKEQMFLMYSNKMIHVHQDPDNTENSLVEVSSIEYAKKHYDTSFLQGFFTAAVLQSLLGSMGSMMDSPNDYKGYGSKSTNTDTKKSTTTTQTDTSKDKQPTTSDRTGSFSTKSSGSTSSSSSTSKSSSSSSTARKSDGSTPSNKSPSKPKTSTKTGSFSTKKR